MRPARDGPRRCAPPSSGRARPDNFPVNKYLPPSQSTRLAAFSPVSRARDRDGDVESISAAAVASLVAEATPNHGVVAAWYYFVRRRAWADDSVFRASEMIVGAHRGGCNSYPPIWT